MADDRPEPGDISAQMAIAVGDSDEAREYLRRQGRLAEEQTVLVRLQAEDLRREDRLRHWSLVVRHISDVLKLSFELALALIFTGFVVVIGAALWAAANDNGLVIEAFSVPPDMAAKGLTGDVVAAKVLDKLAALQAQTASRRAASSYANNWGDDIKVQIPDTGVSIGELNNYLHQWLGHQTRITGEIYRTASGIAVTARAGGDASPTYSGSEAGLDKLLQKAAESVYRSTQPYRYAVYMQTHNRNDEANAVYQELIRTGSPDDRAWAYVGLANLVGNTGGFLKSTGLLRQAIAIKPDFELAYENLAGQEGSLQHDEQSLSAWRKTVELNDRGQDSEVNSSFMPASALLDKQTLALAENDNLQVLAYGKNVFALPDQFSSWESALMSNLQACGALHDPACVQNTWAALPPTKDGFVLLNRHGNLQFTYAAIGRWQDVISLSKDVIARLNNFGTVGAFFTVRAEDPIMALTRAETGDFRSAHALIDKTPPDCVACLRFRGRIDALQKNWNGANDWFARAAKAAPSQGEVWTDWGQMLLAKGDYDAAIARFTTANQRSPHFADPLEMWGEALMQKNRSDLAIAKFSEAAKYAPNWGRLHLKWGQALIYTGDRAGAAKQFAIAARLFITPSEKSELAKVQQHG